MRYLIDDAAMLPATAIFTGTTPVDDMLRAMWCFEDGGYTYDEDYATQYQNYVTSLDYFYKNISNNDKLQMMYEIR